MFLSEIFGFPMETDRVYGAAASEYVDQIRYNIFVLSQITLVLKRGLLFAERRGMITAGHPLY
jgi:hypothetical protein